MLEPIDVIFMIISACYTLQTNHTQNHKFQHITRKSETNNQFKAGASERFNFY